MSVVKKQAVYGAYAIRMNDNGSVEIEHDGEICENAKSAIREISTEAGFVINNDWTGRQTVSKLIDYLNKLNENINH